MPDSIHLLVGAACIIAGLALFLMGDRTKPKDSPGSGELKE